MSDNSSTVLPEDRSIRSSQSSQFTIASGEISQSTLALDGHTLSGVHATKSTTSTRKPCSFTEADFMVDFEEGDPENPLNWSLAKRWTITLVAGFIILNWFVMTNIQIISHTILILSDCSSVPPPVLFHLAFFHKCRSILGSQTKSVHSASRSLYWDSRSDQSSGDRCQKI